MTWATRYDAGGHTPGLNVSAMRALLRGMTPKAVCVNYGVHINTAYRWRRDLVAIESVRVDGWVACFARRRRKPPVRVTEWTPCG